jgi:hypothetical protein
MPKRQNLIQARLGTAARKRHRGRQRHDDPQQGPAQTQGLGNIGLDCEQYEIISMLYDAVSPKSGWGGPGDIFRATGRAVFRTHSAENVDPRDLVYDGDDPGIDGAMIFIDDAFVSLVDEVG